MPAVHSHTSHPYCLFFASAGIPLTMVSQFRVLTHRKLFSIPFVGEVFDGRSLRSLANKRKATEKQQGAVVAKP